MRTYILLLLQIIFAGNSVFSQNIITPKGFTHIGSLRSAGTKPGAIDNNDYYVSLITNKVQWSGAQQTCKNTFGANSSAVSIETVEEWDFLKVMLESYGTGVSTYWTVGMYDRSSNVWRWAENASPFLEWAPWDNGHPASNPTSLHRVLIAHTNRNVASWRSVSNSQLHRFICQVPRSTPIPFSCYDTDLIIVLDSSASIGSHNYKKAKRFAVKLAEEFTAHNSSRISFLIYSDTASAIISLNNSLFLEEISDAILDAPYMKGGTATHLGIDEAILQFQTYPRDVAQNVVVITDGESSDSTLTAVAIEAAKDMGVRTFSVGITPSADKEDLLVITSGDGDYVFTTDECDKLIMLTEPVIRKICPEND